MMSDANADNPLLNELLTEVADSFFSARKAVDEMRAILDTHIMGLKIKENAIRRQLDFLTYLLVDSPTAADFFRMLGVKAESLRTGPCAAVDLPSCAIPFGWRRRSKYVKLVKRCYAELHLLLNDYQHGTCPHPSRATETRPAYPATDCKLVLELAKLINAKIMELNCNMTPSGTLQFVKQFDARSQLNDFVAGANAADYTLSIDAKLKLDPIDLKSLPLVEFPALPAPDRVALRIESYCRKIFKIHKPVLVQRLGELVRKRPTRVMEPKV